MIKRDFILIFLMYCDEIGYWARKQRGVGNDEPLFLRERVRLQRF